MRTVATRMNAMILRILRACLENPVRCRSRRKEAQVSRFVEHFSFNQSLLTSAPTFLKHALRLWSIGLSLPLATIVLSFSMMSSARAEGKQRGRSIEFSEPKNDQVSTNLHQFGL